MKYRKWYDEQPFTAPTTAPTSTGPPTYPISDNEIMNLHGKLYAVCGKCQKLVRLDKPIFGGLHICEGEEE